MLAQSAWLERKKTNERVLAVGALGSCQHRGQRVSSAGEHAGSERRKRKERGQREIETLTRANKACCEKMDGYTDR